MTKASFLGILALTVLGGLSTPRRAAAVVFDDFNVSEFHFGYSPTFSSTSHGTDPSTASADRIEDESLALEGVGFQRLHMSYLASHPTVPTIFRTRHISGGNPGPTPPGDPLYNSANGASPAGNAGFEIPVTTAGVDGFIGYYLKTSTPGWVTSLNLDKPANTGAEMEGSLSLDVIADGEWHLYEWDLDSVTDWIAVPGIGGGGPDGSLTDATYTIDSIWFRDPDGETVTGTTADFDLDFVAWNPAGSIADLLTAPTEDADFDDDTDVDDVDFAAWQSGFGLDTGATHAGGDANGDGAVDGRDFAIWQRQFNDAAPPIGAVPEPAALTLAGLALAPLAARARR
jgi:hypothetical protein